MTAKLRHWFTPHHTNNFRARILHADMFAWYTVCLVLLVAVFRISAKLDLNILGYATNITIDRLISLTNQQRAKFDISPLKYNSLLSRAAKLKAEDMFQNGYWAHNSPAGKTPWDFINGVGYVYTVAGENLAKNFDDTDGVVEAWMDSPTHRENILRPQYDEVGFALVNGNLNGEETTLVVQMFGKQLTKVPDTLANTNEPSFVEPAQAISETSEAKILAPALNSRQTNSLIADKFTPAVNQSIVKFPLIDISSFSKRIVVFFAVLLVVILAVDGFYVWRRNIVRISGKTLAHIFFLLTIVGVVGVLSFGSIL